MTSPSSPPVASVRRRTGQQKCGDPQGSWRPQTAGWRDPHGRAGSAGEHAPIQPGFEGRGGRPEAPGRQHRGGPPAPTSAPASVQRTTGGPPRGRGRAGGVTGWRRGFHGPLGAKCRRPGPPGRKEVPVQLRRRASVVREALTCVGGARCGLAEDESRQQEEPQPRRRACELPPHPGEALGGEDSPRRAQGGGDREVRAVPGGSEPSPGGGCWRDGLQNGRPSSGPLGPVTTNRQSGAIFMVYMVVGRWVVRATVVVIVTLEVWGDGTNLVNAPQPWWHQAPVGGEGQPCTIALSSLCSPDLYSHPSIAARRGSFCILSNRNRAAPLKSDFLRRPCARICWLRRRALLSFLISGTDQNRAQNPILMTTLFPYQSSCGQRLRFRPSYIPPQSSGCLAPTAFCGPPLARNFIASRDPARTGHPSTHLLP